MHARKYFNGFDEDQTGQNYLEIPTNVPYRKLLENPKGIEMCIN